ncbi:cobalt-dependent inorganic pyrophosphatase [archaeon]|nr:cobalt-dependent inorganic pyrophosphatase [archaeon]
MSHGITYVIGHKNPDTDSICSAIAYAWLKRAMGEENVVAARAGNINAQTEFVLEYFQQQPPKYLPDIYPRVKDVMTSDVITVNASDTMNKACRLFKSYNLKLLPLVDSEKCLIGTLSLLDISKIQMERLGPMKSHMLFTSVKNIQEVLGARILNAPMPEKEFSGFVVVGAMTEKSFKKRLQEFVPASTIVVVSDRDEIQKIAIDFKVKCLIVTDGKDLADEFLKIAREKKVNVIVSPHDTAQSSKLIFTSIPVHYAASKSIETLSEDELLIEARGKILRSENQGMPVVNHKRRVVGIVTRSDLLKPPGKQLILVDHNEMTQTIDGAEEVEIIEIIDHHRLGNSPTMKPILFINVPLGSTSTLMAELYQKNNITPEKTIAGLLTAGIISDTILLKSPTSTEKDEQMLKWLSEITGLNYTELGMEIFNATSSLSGRSIEEIVEGDFKDYQVGNTKIGIGQVEVVRIEELDSIKYDILEYLKKFVKNRKYSLVALMVTDILTEGSILLFQGDRRITGRIQYPLMEPNIAELKGILSRKKQLLPYILEIAGA